MAEEATAPAAAPETPATPVEGAAPAAPANDTTPAAPAGAPANDNAIPTEAEIFALADKVGIDKALQMLAKKANWHIDGQVVSVAERAAFREERRKAKQALEERQRSIEEQLGHRVKESESEIELGRALRAAYEAGDFDQLARGLGKKDWNEIQEEFIAKLADPNHKRLTELEKKLKEKEAAEEQARREGETRAQHQARMQAIQQYKIGVSNEMKTSDSPVLKALGDNPDVVHMVYAIRNEHWQKSGTEMPLAQCLVSKLPGTDVTLKTLLKSWHDQLTAAFREGEPAPTVAAVAQTAKGKTAPAPTVAPSPPKPSDKGEWTKRGAALLDEAFRAEERLKAEERRKGNTVPA